MVGSRIISPAWYAQAAISASDQDAARPVTRTQSKLRNKLFKTNPGVNSVDIYIDMGQERYCNALALASHNLTFQGSITIKAGSAQGADDRLAATTFDAWEMLVGAGDCGAGEEWVGAGGFIKSEFIETYFSAGTTRFCYFDFAYAPHWTLTLSDVDNPDGLLSLGRVALGYYRESQRGVCAPLTPLPVDPSQVTYMKSGVRRSNKNAKYRTMNYLFTKVPREDFMGLWWITLQAMGHTEDFFFDAFPEEPWGLLRIFNQMYCHVQSGGIQQLAMDRRQRGGVQLTLRESK